MPDQDNIPTEKMSLSYSDFDENQSNSFGIQDTKTLSSKDLQSFLLSDPDDIQDTSQTQTQDQKQDPPAPKKEDQAPKQDTPKKEEKVDKQVEGEKALNNYLWGEEGEEEEKKAGTPNEDAKDAPGSSDDDTYATLAKDFLRLGVFTKNSEDETEETIDIKTPEEFLDRFSLEKKKGAINILENFLSQFGDDYRKMFDAVFVNGVAPQEYLSSFAKIETLGNLDLSSPDNQERVVRTYYKGLKWDEQKIENRIQKLRDYDDLEDEAKTYHEVLLNKEREQAAQMEQKKVEEANKTKEKELATRKSYQRILNEKLKSQDFDGLSVTQKDVEETLSYMTDKKYKLPSGELLSEYDKDLLELGRAENHELKVKLGLLLRKKLDLTTVKKTAVSKKAEPIFTLSTKNAKKAAQEKEQKSFFS